MTTRTTRRRNALVILGAAVLGGALTWTIVRLGDDDADSPTSGDLAADIGIEHVHGLGVDPGDSTLIVATHYGSFRLAADGSQLERIGDSLQDTMGFTVAGPRHYLGSGHPDLQGVRNGQPTRLGLIESTDGGLTWTIRSLGDEVDFHALAYADDQVYGWDSGTGRFMVSTDKRTWETRSRLDLYGFDIDPADADHLIGAGPEGLVESGDGGREWAPLEGPGLVTLSWDDEAGLWGADAAGTVWHRASEGWEEAGELPGEPQAFLATADSLYAAAHDAQDQTGIYESTDRGRTWQLRYGDPPH